VTEMARLRKSWKKSQAEVAKNLGISRSYYAYMEQGRLQPSKKCQKKIEKFFEKPWNYLVKH